MNQSSRWPSVTKLRVSIGGPDGSTVRRYEAWADGRRAGTVGLITAESAPFCADCRRLRLSARGELLGCYMLDRGVDLTRCFRGDGSVRRQELRAQVRRAISQKAGIRRRRRRLAAAEIGG